MKINIETNTPEIWIRICFHNGFESPSLFIILLQFKKSYLILFKNRLPGKDDTAKG